MSGPDDGAQRRPLPYGRHDLDEDDIAAVERVLRGDWLTTGPTVAQFETALAEAVGARHAVAVSSGTAALHLVARGLGLGPGDAAIVPAITFLASANAVIHSGAEVIFADVDPESGLMGVAQAQAALARAPGALSVKTVLPVHFAGQAQAPADLRDWAAGQNLSVLEDACHALGSTYGAGNKEHMIGACAHCDAAMFSFHPVKTIAAGEGGAVTTNDDALAQRIRLERNHGMVRHADSRSAPWAYEMHAPGFNYRLSDIHAALGLSQLGKLARFAARRRELVAHYDKLLAPLAPQVRPLARNAGCNPAWHLYVVLIDFAAIGRERAQVMAHLADRGIATQVHYPPLHRQPFYAERYGEQALEGAESYYARCLSLPLFPAMGDGDPQRVVDALRDAMA